MPTRKKISEEQEAFDFGNEEKVMKLFTDNARTYIQLSSAALVLCSAFLHEVLGIPKESTPPPDGWMIATWIGFLLTIVSGAFYQYLAAKYLESHLGTSSYKGWDWLVIRCGTVYGVMLAAFYGGAACFTIQAIMRLSHYRK
jgi:hypothetical protein